MDVNRQEVVQLLQKYLHSHNMQELCPHGNPTTVEVHREIIKSSQ